MNLSANFTLEALVFSETAVRRGLANDPNDEQIANLTELAQTLERVVLLFGFPLHIHSAFRSAKVNAAIGGSSHSAHMDGYAADFTCEQFGSPLAVCQAIASSGIPYDQLIQEGGIHGWTHISVAPALRKELLTAHFEGGKVTYTAGLGESTLRVT
jgi:hypothetical protein